ncbi:hypothetical protein ACFYVL_09565 [Streptomyces sp. NPDC004111]|uniref:hypothetical protein n=1 Tax=Streptomyces sp. NPDC004111 TaxID=3364690 RepID=UPI0036748A04
MAGRPAHPRTAPPTRVLPPVRVALPDGEVRALLVRQWQTARGTWVCTVALRAWASRAASTGEDLTEDLIEIDVPAARVGKVPGISYEGVPVLRAPHPTPPPAPAAPTAPPAPEPAVTNVPRTKGGEPGWLAERTKPTTTQHLRVRFHAVTDCWTLTGEKGAVMPVAQARHMIDIDPAAESCEACTGPTPPTANSR